MERITSKNNPSVMAAAKLSDKKYREKEGVFAFEGIKLFGEAVKNGANIRRVFVTEDAFEKYGEVLSSSVNDVISSLATYLAGGEIKDIY